MLRQITLVKQQNDQILAFFSKTQNIVPNSFVENLPVQLPLNSFEDVKQIEEYLQTNQHYSALVKLNNDLYYVHILLY